MGFQAGIVGLPNVGKSTLFNALGSSEAEAANYPFCTIEPNVGLVPVPDKRLDAISTLVQPEKTVSAMMRFVDIAGLIAGASQGEGLGNQFLGHIRDVNAIIHVVRCYEDENVTHVTGKLDPASDIDTINTELALSDLDTVEKALTKLNKKIKTRDKTAKSLQLLLKRVQTHLAEGLPVRKMDLHSEEQTLIKSYHFLTAKPVLYVANVGEEALLADEGSPATSYVNIVRDIAQSEKADLIVLCASLEAEMAALNPDEKRAFLHDFGLETSGLDQLIQSGYRLLGLQTFFTAGPKEVRAWTVSVGASAPEAAGVIHSDFEKTFIRAEVISFEDYILHKGEQGAKSAGCWQLEGKEYLVKDGDIIYFRTGG